jgi:uncharacterized membrane protein
MTYLIIAIVVWSLVHFIPATAVSFRASLIQRMGLPAYKGLFSLLAGGALLLIVLKWGSTSSQALYVPPAWGVWVTIVLTLLAAIGFLAPYIDNNFRRWIRHPQLTGAFLWGIGHLFSNGEARSVILFGGLALWALLQMILTNRRDGKWQKPEPVSLGADTRLLLAALGFYAMFMYTHAWLFGVGPVPYLSQ